MEDTDGLIFSYRGTEVRQKQLHANFQVVAQVCLNPVRILKVKEGKRKQIVCSKEACLYAYISIVNPEPPSTIYKSNRNLSR